jgi:hypothetical protein
MEYLKNLWARVTVHWNAVVAVLLMAIPSILDYLGVINLQPLLLDLGVPEAYAGMIVQAMPFVLAFLKPMFAVAPRPVEAAE